MKCDDRRAEFGTSIYTLSEVAKEWITSSNVCDPTEIGLKGFGCEPPLDPFISAFSQGESKPSSNSPSVLEQRKADSMQSIKGELLCRAYPKIVTLARTLLVCGALSSMEREWM